MKKVTLTVHFDDSFEEVIDEDANMLCPEFSEGLAAGIMGLLARVAEMNPVVTHAEVGQLEEDDGA